MVPRLIPIHQEMSKLVSHHILLALFIVGFACASTSFGALTESNELKPDEIFKRYKNAVVRIEITLHGASLGVGSGFFYSSTGEIATSLHVIRPYLVHPATEISVKLANGKVFRSAKIGACGDERGVDLCLLKVEHKTKSILPLVEVEVTPGESVVAIGHPRGLDFSISTGIVSALRVHPAGWSEVQIDAAISPGNSGGPIINREGRAIGVVYQFERDGQNLNFGILAQEAVRIRESGLPFLGISDARKNFKDRSEKIARRFNDKWIKPSIQSFTDPKARPSGLKWMRAQLGSKSFSMLLPELFQNCEKSDEEGTAATSCSSAGGDVIVTVQKRKRSLEGSLASYRGRKLVESRPLSLVERLESEGLWDEPKITKSSFTSRPSVARCSAFQKKSTVSSDESAQISIRKKGFFQDATSICRFETENDSEPGAASTSQWIEVGGDFYGVNVWAADPGRLPFLQGLADLVLVSAGATSDQVKIAYHAMLRPSLKRNQFRPNEYFSGADVSDSFSDDTSTVTIVKAAAVAPSQMNRQFIKWANAISKSQNPKSFNGAEVSSTEIAGRTARVGTWLIPHPSDRRKNELFMMTARFGTHETWIIYETQAIPSMTQANRIPSVSLTSDMQRFRSWTQEFQPSP